MSPMSICHDLFSLVNNESMDKISPERFLYNISAAKNVITRIVSSPTNINNMLPWCVFQIGYILRNLNAVFI